MSKGLLVALSGPMYSGKTTASQFFVRTGNWDRIRFAGPFKSMIFNFLKLSGYNDELAYKCVDGALKQTRLPDLGISMRWILQMIGSDFPACFNYPGIWSNLTMSRANTLRKTRNVVIDDLRFIHEDNDIHNYGGVSVLIRGNHEHNHSKDNIETLAEIFGHDKIITDKVFANNLIKAWDNTFSNMGIERLQPNIRVIFQEFIHNVLIPGRFKDIINPRNHISENSLPERFDYMIDNSGSISDFDDRISDFIIRLGHKNSN